MKIFSKEHVFLNQKFTTKDEYLKFISNIAEDLGISKDKDDTYEGFLRREAEISTGLCDGFAIPHTRTESIVGSGVIVVKSEEDVEWGTIDEKPVRTMIALLVPKDDANKSYIKLLANLSRKLMNKEFATLLANSEDVEEISTIMIKALEGGE